MDRYKVRVSTGRNEQIAYADDMAQAERRAQNILSWIGEGALAHVYDMSQPAGSRFIKELKRDPNHVQAIRWAAAPKKRKRSERCPPDSAR